MRLAPLFAIIALVSSTGSFAQEIATAPLPLTAEAINGADLSTIPVQYMPPVAAEPTNAVTGSDLAIAEEPTPGATLRADAAIARLQVLLDRAGASPGVIDGFDGDNVRKAVMAFEQMRGLPADGLLEPEVIAALQTATPVFGHYTITPEDVSAIVAPLPTDYAELAQRDFLGYTSVVEELAERFHMDEDLLRTLNPGIAFTAGDMIVAAAYGPDLTGEVARIEADKTLRQVRAYDANDRLIAAYPATIGSEDNPSPSGTHTVDGVAPMPNYTYNPKVNFQQGDNGSVLTIPPGPNGPVGSMWIDLSEPTFGIHGTPSPAKIDKTGSHGCVRLTNWDANELAGMVKPGVPVDFIG